MRRRSPVLLVVLAGLAAAGESPSYVERVDAFWTWFRANAAPLRAAIHDGTARDWVDRIAERVGALHPALAWELRPGRDPDTDAFVLACAGDRRLQLLARRWKEAAPVVPGWEFHDFKRPVARRSMRFGGVAYEAADFKVQFRPRRDAERFDLRVYHPAFAGAGEEERLRVCFVWLETVLGERVLDEHVAGVDPVATAPGGTSRSMDRLAADLAAAMDERGWTVVEDPLELAVVYRAEPPEKEAYAPREDLVAGWTVFRDYDDDVLTPAGAALVYVCFPHGRLAAGRQTHERGEIEDALAEALAEGGLGYVVGGGHGVQRAYIELLVFDLDRARERIAMAVAGEERIPSAELRGITLDFVSRVK